MPHNFLRGIPCWAFHAGHFLKCPSNYCFAASAAIKFNAEPALNQPI